MHLSPKESDRLLLFLAAELARRRRADGVRLNYPEARALIADEICEGARRGRSVAELMDLGGRILTTDDVMPGVADLIDVLQVEPMFEDGQKLVTVHQPIRPGSEPVEGVVPGEFRTAEGEIELNAGRRALTLVVRNTGDRPVQIGSHFHFFEVNDALDFDRGAAFGMRLDVPAGHGGAVRAGRRARGRPGGAGRQPLRLRAEPADRGRDRRCGQGGGFEARRRGRLRRRGHGRRLTMLLSRAEYCELFGPTVGDRVRLGDTDLWAEVEQDLTVYGDECVFGGGKTLRDGLGTNGSVTAESGALDFVITGALIVDAVLGIVKADIGIKDGRIAAIGKAGNPDVMDGVHPQLVVGANTDVRAAEGMIVTAGGIDVHVHFDSAGLCEEAISAGITTMIGGGLGPVTVGICSSGTTNLTRMLQAAEDFPLNFGFLGKGSASSVEPLLEQIRAGAIGLKIHEDWGAMPAVIHSSLDACDELDVQLQIHTDTLNESGFFERTLAAIGGRTIHTYHSEGAGGGHAPDIIRVSGEANCLPSSTNPTNPYTLNTFDEHLDMVMVCHHLSPRIPEDVAFAESRIRRETIAAEDVLHDLGAISVIGSDSQGMGRIGETIARTWQLAAHMKGERGSLPEDNGDRARQPPHQALRLEVHDQRGEDLRDRRRTSARWSPGSSPTSCSGTRASSASSPRSCSKAASPPGR